MNKLILSAFLLGLLGRSAYAHDLILKYSKNITPNELVVLESAMEEVASLLPPNLKKILPKNIEINLATLTHHKKIPADICANLKTESTEKPFIYGLYNPSKNSLTINRPVLDELRNGRERSFKISCQHKSLYNQAIATIVHELTHAYDFNNGRISNSAEFIRIAGFKKGLLKIKNKNIKAMRSADTYELVNIAESFAVNMEYFSMDPEFMCRKPSIFNFFQNLFKIDPYPKRDCKVNNTVMMSGINGFTAVELDPKRVYRIDYLMASPGKGISSGFGHSMLRLVMCAPEHYELVSRKIVPPTPFGKKCLDDKLFHLVVSYRANVDSATENYIKGLTGGYPSMLFILNFPDVLMEYNRDELRDVVSYPLNLKRAELVELVQKIKEEHWNYSGSYKFITNNCAVESFNLLATSLKNADINSSSSLTPKGVLEDLDELEVLSLKSNDIETYKAKTEQILLAYSNAYEYVPKSDEKTNKKSIQDFIIKSNIDQRRQSFETLFQTKLTNMNLHTEIKRLKELLIKASSFSVMEQQILTTLALNYRKKATEFLTNPKDQRIKDILEDSGGINAKPFNELSNTGYGIPFEEEILIKDLNDKKNQAAETGIKIEAYLKELMPNEFEMLAKISENINIFNQFSRKVRNDFKLKLSIHIEQVLRQMMRSEASKIVLEKALAGDDESIQMIRNEIGNDLETENEIKDVKLRKQIEEIIQTPARNFTGV